MTATARDVRYDAGGHRLVEVVQQRIHRDAAQMRERVDGELPAKNRCEQQDDGCTLREVSESAGDHVADIQRDGRPRASLRVRWIPSSDRRRTVSATKSGFPSVFWCRSRPSSGDAIVGAANST